jgi:transketolase
MNNDTIKIRKKILSVSHLKKEGHIGSSYSVIELLYVIVGMLKKNYKGDSSDDLLIVSKAHASLGLYGILNHYGMISDEELFSFCDFDSKLGGHLTMNSAPLINTSTGSLGHGLPIAVGIALSNKLDNVNKKIFVLLGDGELHEGTNWESILTIVTRKLDNITIVIDYNNSNDESIDFNNVQNLLGSIGFDIKTIDGHNISSIVDAIIKEKKVPTIIVANTIKGKGVSEFESNPKWHHRSPDGTEFEIYYQELDNYEKIIPKNCK